MPIANQLCLVGIVTCPEPPLPTCMCRCYACPAWCHDVFGAPCPTCVLTFAGGDNVGARPLAGGRLFFLSLSLSLSLSPLDRWRIPQKCMSSAWRSTSFCGSHQVLMLAFRSFRSAVSKQEREVLASTCRSLSFANVSSLIPLALGCRQRNQSVPQAYLGLWTPVPPWMASSCTWRTSITPLSMRCPT